MIYSFKYLFILLIISLCAWSCEEPKREFELVEFKSDYKFSSAITAQVASDTIPWKYQVSAADYANKGDYKNALIQWDSAMGTSTEKYSESETDSIKARYTKVDAKDYIITQAANHQVIIINEAHHNSLHRAFTRSLLKELYDAGYQSLGLEALSYKDDLDSLQLIRKYPVQETGYYIRDPQFGNLVRDAIELGYTVFPYETKNHQADGKPREINQARNIQKVINARPSGKFLIHCGFDHVLEGKHGSWEKAMAGRLKEYTGINPLTINQVVYSEKSQAGLNYPLLKSMNVEKATVLVNEDGQPMSYNRKEAFTDIAVLHPNTNYKNKRPNWIFDDEYNKVVVDLNGVPFKYPVMVLAFKKGEDIHTAVPVDIAEIEKPTDTCVLALKKYSYDIVVTNGSESVKFEKKV